ncbi:MAG: DUF4040 domain-containing protein [Acidimicrobiales bacterium]|nr:DUF4040 domain-containing protein [Acidimicrobiales bacterium]
MMWLLLGAHGLGIGLAAAAGGRSLRAGLAVAAIAPAATAGWAAAALLRDRPPEPTSLVWVDGLDLSIRFQADGLALLMTLLVSGIGALVFLYGTGYFNPGPGARFPASLLAFSASMLGLVWADSVWTLFIFWEFTSITSFLLVGHKHEDPTVRAAARRALMITGAGGLVLLAGLLVLTSEIGSSTLTDLAPVSGPTATLAAILILVGAATKSAQVPFHVWLPGAMAAPTPVSAYLHSATMVKAGVLLVAVAGPAFVDVAAWKVLGLSFGITSLLWGAIGALRHRDAKLVLAWGTVSQLGLMITLLALGEPKATFAGVSMLFAHALFKAALFLVVGEIDVRTGTRDIAALGGLSRTMPVAFGVAVAAGLSMAGAPPLLGFMTKEAAIEAALKLSGPDRAIALGAIIAGSVLTVAYTTRFLFGAFGRGPATAVAPRRLAMTVPAVILAGAGVLGFVAVATVNGIVGPAAAELDPEAGTFLLIQWPGLKTAFVISMAILASGAALGTALSRHDHPARPAPATLGADAVDRSIDGLLSISPRITALVQHGSLPVYLATLATAAVLAATPFATELTLDHLVWWDNPLQGGLALGIVVAAFAGAFVSSRLGAALTLGAVGLGVSGLFVVHGAPDLALTQLLVETVVVVGFVLGLGHLTRRFPPVNGTWRGVRIAVAGASGLGAMIALAAASAQPTGRAPLAELTSQSVEEGGGDNIVNVILTDMRALDTLGEVVVLATVAIGILSLARVRRQEAATRGPA